MNFSALFKRKLTGSPYFLTGTLKFSVFPRTGGIFPLSGKGFPGGRRPGLTKIYSRIILDLLYIFIFLFYIFLPFYFPGCCQLFCTLPDREDSP